MSRGVLDQIPRSSLALLLASQAAVIAPHAFRLPPWILLLWAGCVTWRVLVYQGRWGYPPTLAKGLFVVFAVAGVIAGYGLSFSLDPAVALLILAFALKLLEMRDRRDALVVIFLGYFVIATQFLFEQGIMMTLYQLLATLVVSAALIALHESWNRPRPWVSLRTAGVILAQAIPLAIVVFVFFPRVAPLWSVPLPDSASRTGLSDSMTPGEISQLGRSSRLAFRVDFEGRPPAPPALYWRALTLSRYEGGTWSSGRSGEIRDRPVYWVDSGAPPDWLRRIEPEGSEIRYSVLAEPTYRPWLYALDYARPLTPNTGVGRDFRVLHRTPVTQRIRYEVVSQRAALDPELPRWYQLLETALPGGDNPRTRAFVRELEPGAWSAPELAGRLMEYFAREPFHYTLNPPTLGEHDIDDFLFETRRGFCGHYAGAFVYMMRLAGVPARVVAGYQGGEPNPMGDYLIVRERDAHAWAEIWVEGEGWRRVDPTTAVAPDRIELGAEAAFADNEEEAAFADFGRGGVWRSLLYVAEVYYFLDSLQHRWNVMVLSYDATLQSRVLRNMLGEITPMRVAVAAGLAGGVAVLIAMLGALPGLLRARRPTLLRIHDRFCTAFGRAGTPRHPSESPRSYGARLCRAYPELEAEILRVTSWLEDALFGPAAGAREHASGEVRTALRRIRMRLVLRRLAATFPGLSGRTT